ncbi:profilin I [Tieghemostelium lacteum]|uniref:Profilin I n=1 Tax=Tieghemostelium lacteum TaxID=361077 RepID=A0A152A740_TIELA|nr:profilin I [Tieghemostelium lacteum]|eukprot:KYR02039.1 profilin I [Tieghemostelium lacteum]
MNSFQVLLEENLILNNSVNEGAIYDENGEVKASSKGWILKDREFLLIKNLFKQPSDAFSDGIMVDGEVFNCIQADDKSIYGKIGDRGLLLSKSRNYITMAYYNESNKVDVAKLNVERLSDALRGKGL